MTEEIDTGTFVTDFHARHGRAPRILHIGNIANNAYENALLFNQVGFDCDVLCPDYYHIMGCPEWEDADFSGDVGDHFWPSWHRVDLRGFTRPRWFIQGPVSLCVEYLIAKRSGAIEEADRLWRQAADLNGTTARGNGRSPGFMRWVHWIGRVARLRFSRIRGAGDLYRALGVAVEEILSGGWLGRALVFGGALASLLLWPLLVAALLVIGAARRAFLASRGNQSKLRPHARVLEQTVAFADAEGVAGRVLVLVLSLMALAAATGRRMRATSGAGAAAVLETRWFRARVDHLVRIFREQFPDRADSLTVADLLPYAPAIPQWKRLFEHYDILQGYSIDGILPLLAGMPYFAFEHGTIREIPFRETAEGRRTALVYRAAEHVFVTNFDCLSNAARLAPGRHTPLNHPFDEDHGLRVSGWEAYRETLSSELESDFLFFFPTRHDWVEGTGYADKGNDVFFRALAELRRAGWRVGAICCAWGANVSQSKALLVELDCSAIVKWIEPLPTVQFERMARAAHCVVDQFVIGGFGGVMFKAMAVGAPVLTYLDITRLKEQYSEVPPVINCRTTTDVVTQMTELLKDPRQVTTLGAASREWMKRNHSKGETVRRQVHAYTSFLAGRRTGIA